jgi:aspartyl/glutamyl-tRNA(Asn/Gln) amidotransferase C subunit
MQNTNEVKERVKQSAESAHLAIDEAELNIFVHDFIDVFKLLDTIKNVDTDKVAVMTNPSEYMRDSQIIK